MIVSIPAKPETKWEVDFVTARVTAVNDSKRFKQFHHTAKLVSYLLESKATEVDNENTETSNEFYGKLNARFDSREQQLRALGYVRETLSAYNLALYVRKKGMRVHCVQTAAMSHADERAWLDIMDDCKRFCESLY